VWQRERHNIFGGSAISNGQDGIHIERNGWGTSTFGFTVEANAEFGIRLVGACAPDPCTTDDAATICGDARFCRFMSTWDEGNRKGSVHFGEHATDNVVDYVRYSSGPPQYETAHQGRNLVWGSNISGSGPGVSDGGRITP
jgi:hypothetical protein